jgi:hypothetical protein
VTLAFLFLPGMRDLERAGALSGGMGEDDTAVGFPITAPLEGPMIPAAFAEPVVAAPAAALPEVHP